MAICFGLLLATVTGWGAWQRNSEFPLASFVGKDLRRLSEDQQKPIDQFLASKGQTREDPFRRASPWALWDWHGNGSRYVLITGQPEMMIPGESRAGIFVLDSHGTVLDSSDFCAGYRTMLDSAKMEAVPGVGKVIHFLTSPEINGRRDAAGFYVGLDNCRPAIIRIADSNGRAVKNVYSAPNFQLGPSPVVGRIAGELLTGSTIQVLEALTWCGGPHQIVSTAFSPVYHERISSAIRYQVLASTPEITARVAKLTHSDNPWIAEEARLVQANKGWDSKLLVKQTMAEHKSLKITESKVGDGGLFDRAAQAIRNGDRIDMIYTLRTLQCKVLESNDRSGGIPISITVGQGDVIDGWDLGVLGMKVGGTREIVVPSSLGYGPLELPNLTANSDLRLTVRITDRGSSHDLETVSRDLVLGRGRQVASGNRVRLRYGTALSNGYPLRDIAKSKAVWIQATHSNDLGPSNTIAKSILGMRVGGTRKVRASFFFEDNDQRPFEASGATFITVEVLGIDPKG